MEEVRKKRDWHNRNYPQRGETICLKVSEMNFHPDVVVYLGSKVGSGFFWIGRYKDVPEEYQGLTIVETYHREIEYPGEVILTSDIRGNGPYWNWSEADKDVPPAPKLEYVDPSGTERLLIAILRDEAHEYRNKLRQALKYVHDPDKARVTIAKVRKLHEERLQLLTETNTGQYIIQRTEDEAYVVAIHPEWQNVSYERRYGLINKAVAEIAKERVRNADDSHYAHIKGRSVKHE